jgi:hypothetical protein
VAQELTGETGTAAPPRRVWRHRSFVRLWAGQSAGSVSDQLLPIALSLYVVERGGDVSDVSLLLGGRALALVVCLLAGGVLADRMHRIRLLVTADLFRAAVLAGTVLALPRLPLTALAVVTMLVGAGEALSRPAYRASVPGLLPSGLLEVGNALVSASQRGAAVLGALGGAVLVTSAGARTALLVAAGMFAAGAVVTVGVRGTETTPARGSVLADVADGVRAIRDRPWIPAVMGTVCLHLMAGTAAALTLLPVVATRELGGAGVYGAAVAAMAAGALPAVAVAARYRPTRPGRAAMLALVGYALVPLSLALPIGAAGVIAAFALGGFVVEFFFVYWLAALQRNVPRQVLGKVFALDQFGAYALLPVGYALVGPAVAAWGQQPVLIGGAVLVAVSSLAVLAVPGVATFGNTGR